MNKRLVAGLALAGAFAVAAPMVAHAWGGGERCADGPRAGMMHKHGHQHGKHGMHGESGMPGERMGGRGFMSDLQLSDEQRGKLAELRKANRPAMQEQAKALREARRELRALGFSADYDEAKARAIAERAAKASADMAAQRAKAANDFFQVLTPEQRQKFSERMARMEERRAGKREGRQGPAERSDAYGPDAGPRV
jgi:Spy/CpxP family protein refolding chaperone